MILANWLSPTIPNKVAAAVPGQTTGPAITARSGAGHFGPVPTAPPSIPAVPATAPPTSPAVIVVPGMDTNTKWLLGGVLGVAALGFGVYKYTHRKR